MHERPQGSHFHDPDLMNNPTKTAKGDEMTSQASSSSLPIVQPSIQLMPQLSKRFFRCFANKAAEVGPKLVVKNVTGCSRATVAKVAERFAAA